MAAVARMAEAAGVPPTRLMTDFAALAIGPGRIDFSDYERLRLYDEALLGPRRSARHGRRRAAAASWRWRSTSATTASPWPATASPPTPISSAHGLPTVPILAIYRAGLATPGPPA